MVILVDCNNFFASCERVFNPGIRKKPVVVLSNNDGAIVARSNEAKALGIGMGVPLFEIKEIVIKHNVHVFSSNYALYGDLSNRVMEIITSIIPEIEAYSIDEAFLDVKEYDPEQLEELAWRIKNTVRQWTGIPVSVGIAPTKVLAKVASKIAKKGTGVFSLLDPEIAHQSLSNFKVEDLWGIGTRYAKKLNALNIYTALQFREMPLTWVSKNMTVNGLRIVNELNGISCIPVIQFIPERKAIGSAKGFGNPVRTQGELLEALTAYLSACAVKMRNQGSAASTLSVFIQTNYFNKLEPQYGGYKNLTLPSPTDLTPVLLKYAKHALSSIYRPGYSYKRVGVLLTGFVPSNSIQQDMFEIKDLSKLHALQMGIDNLNKRFDRDQVRFACQGFSKRWKMKQEKLSPNYTTSIDDILTVKV